MTPFVFPRWANKTRALAGVLLGGAPLYLTGIVWYGFSPKTTDVGYEPKQPVPYSHALHAGQRRGAATRRFEPLEPSPELASRLRARVEEFATQGQSDGLEHLYRRYGVIPLACTQLDLWVLRPDGQVLSIDHESAAQRAYPETDLGVALWAIEKGTADYPELAELLAAYRAQGR